MTSQPPLKNWELLAQRPGPIGHLKIATNTYRQPDGATADWDILTGPDTVAVLALTAASEIVLVRQYRPGPDLILDELPGGAIDDGENTADAAARELLEETGYVGRVEIVTHTWMSANATRKQWVAVATNCQKSVEPAPEPGEFCEPMTVPLQEFRERLRAGQLTDAGIAYLALDHLGLL